MIAIKAKSLTIAGCLLMLTSPLAQAADADGNYALRGVGNGNCGEIVEALQEDDPALQQSLSSWMSGYVTSYNRITDETYDIVPVVSADELLIITTLICQQNPESNFEAALRAVFDLFDTARLTRESPVVEVTHDDRTVLTREDTLALLQERLADRGLYDAQVDGAYGPSTRTALERFQDDAGLEVTGVPDIDTKLNLLLDVER